MYVNTLVLATPTHGCLGHVSVSYPYLTLSSVCNLHIHQHFLKEAGASHIDICHLTGPAQNISLPEATTVGSYVNSVNRTAFSLAS